MSKFWNGASSSSSSDSSDSGSASEVEDVHQTVSQKKNDKSWAAMVDSSSDEEETKRVIKSAKDKRWDELRGVITKMNQHMNTQDFVELDEDYETLVKLLGKAEKTIQQEGAPKFLLKALTKLQDYVSDKFRDKAAMKKCSKQKASAVNKLMRKVPKVVAEYQLQIDELIRNNEFDSSAVEEDSGSESDTEESSEDSDSESGSDSESSDSDSEEESSDSSSSSSSPSSSSSSSSESSDESERSSSDSESDSDSSSSSSSSSSSDSGSSVGDDDETFEVKHARAMIKWGYKEGGKSEDKKASRRELLAKRAEEAERKRQMKVAREETAAATAAPARRASVVLAECDDNTLLLKAKEIISQRTRRGGERAEQLDLLRRVVTMVSKRGMQEASLDILRDLATMQLDVSHFAAGFPTVPAWQQACDDVTAFFEILVTNKGIRFPAVNEGEAGAGTVGPDPLPVTFNFIDRLDDCLTSAFQNTDPYSKEYRERMLQLVELHTLIWVAYVLFKSRVAEHGVTPELYRIACKLAEHTYYLPSSLASKRWALVESKLSPAVTELSKSLNLRVPKEDPNAALKDLCELILENASTDEVSIRFRAESYLAYNAALHDKFEEARDILQPGLLYEQALTLTVTDQILYNRCLTQLGLAAFRQGNVAVTATALSEICGTGRQRELLAQGVAIVKGFEKTAEQEKGERRRLLPAHLHINLDVVEAAYNICSMLSEVLQVNSVGESSRLHGKGSRFKRALEAFEKSSTPPETSREYVLGAAKCIQRGEWEAAEEMLDSMKFWDELPSGEGKDRVKEVLTLRVKEVALQAYCINYAHLCGSLSLKELSVLFQLEESRVKPLINRMIYKREIPGLWNADSTIVLVHHSTPSNIQALSATIADQVSTLLDQNEALLARQH